MMTTHKPTAKSHAIDSGITSFAVMACSMLVLCGAAATCVWTLISPAITLISGLIVLYT